MTTDASTIKPTNKIVVDSINLHVTTKNVETGTNVYPGRLVMVGTNDDDVVVCDGSTHPACGWAGYEQTAKADRPATVDTVYTTGDKIAVIWGPGMRIVGHLGNIGASVVVGDLLTYAAAGNLTPGTAGTHHIYAVCEESATVTAAAGVGADIIVRSLI